MQVMPIKKRTVTRTLKRTREEILRIVKSNPSMTLDQVEEHCFHLGLRSAQGERISKNTFRHIYYEDSAGSKALSKSVDISKSSTGQEDIILTVLASEIPWDAKRKIINKLTMAALAFFLVLPMARADQQFFVEGKQVTKVEALRVLIANPKASVLKACPVELTDKATFKCKKDGGRES